MWSTDTIIINNNNVLILDIIKQIYILTHAALKLFIQHFQYFNLSNTCWTNWFPWLHLPCYHAKLRMLRILKLSLWAWWVWSHLGQSTVMLHCSYNAQAQRKSFVLNMSENKIPETPSIFFILDIVAEIHWNIQTNRNAL